MYADIAQLTTRSVSYTVPSIIESDFPSNTSHLLMVATGAPRHCTPGEGGLPMHSSNMTLTSAASVERALANMKKRTSQMLRTRRKAPKKSSLTAPTLSQTWEYRYLTARSSQLTREQDSRERRERRTLKEQHGSDRGYQSRTCVNIDGIARIRGSYSCFHVLAAAR